MATVKSQTSERAVVTYETKSGESSRTSDGREMQEQSSTINEETSSETREKRAPTKKNSWKKSEGRNNLMKMVSSIKEKEGGKLSLTDSSGSWEQKVDEAYTELILALQEVWESHVVKIRSQLRNMMAHPGPKGTRDQDTKKSLFNVEAFKGPTKEEQKRLPLILLISLSVALLAICLVNTARIGGLRHDMAVINQEHDRLLQQKIGSMIEKMDRLPEIIRKQNQPLITEMRKEIRYALDMYSGETKEL